MYNPDFDSKKGQKRPQPL